MNEDYTVFVHWRDEGGRILTQQDNQPRNGTYPMGLWNEGEIVEDLYHLTAPAGRQFSWPWACTAWRPWNAWRFSMRMASVW
jgi:hypothetical protein